MRVYAPPGPRQMIGKAHSPTVDGQKTETCLSTLFSTPRAPRFNVDRPHELTRFLEAPAGGGVNIEFGGHGGSKVEKKVSVFCPSTVPWRLCFPGEKRSRIRPFANTAFCSQHEFGGTGRCPKSQNQKVSILFPSTVPRRLCFPGHKRSRIRLFANTPFCSRDNNTLLPVVAAGSNCQKQLPEATAGSNCWYQLPAVTAGSS